MSLFIILARLVAIAASGIILMTIANSTVNATGATGSDAEAIYALALAVFVTAGIIGLAWSAKRYGLALFLGICLISGEAYNFLKTAEREVTSREAAQSATDTALLARETLRETIRDAMAALQKAQAAVTDKSAEKTCVKNCAQLLGNAVVSAQANLDRAEAAYAQTARPPSATPLADRAGIAAWMIDLMAAAFKSLAMNGLAAGLVAFGAHGAAVTVVKKASTVADQVPANAAPLPRVIVADEPAPMALTAANDGGQSDLGVVSEFELAKVAALFRGEIDPDGNGGGGGKVIRPRKWHRDEVRADLTAKLANGGNFPSQVAMARMYGVPQSTLSNWFDQWAAEGMAISRQQVGRRKRVG